MIQSYLIHLGQNFWKEPDSDPSFLGRYYTSLVCEDDAWRKVTDFIAANGYNTLIIDLGEGVQYESHPELAIEGAWSKEKLKKELDRLRRIGLNPIPKLNFSTCHDAWLGKYARMVSTPTYYKVASDLISEVSELFDTPDYLHLGMDEEAYNPHLPYYYIEMQSTYGITCVRSGELYWKDLYFLCDCCRKNGVRPWFWADQGWMLPEEALKYTPKDALLSNAIYGRLLNPDLLPPWNQQALKLYYTLGENGFEQVPTCSCTSSYLNSQDTISLLKDVKGIKGFCMAPWYRTREIDILKHFACAKTFNHSMNDFFGGKSK